MAVYEELWRALDRELRAAGLRRHFAFIGGDLVGAGQGPWFKFMAGRMSDVLDGYSVPIYWEAWDTEKLARRLSEVRDIVAGLPARARKPLYVTEFGVKGHRSAAHPEPGLDQDGRLIVTSIENAFQHAWFDVLAARLGYVATVKW